MAAGEPFSSAHEPLRLVRRAAVPEPPRDLDDAQRRVVAWQRGAGPLRVLGAPGTGKTTVLVEAVAARAQRDGTDPASVLVLAASRRAASELRERLAARLRRVGSEPLARTPHSYAFGVLRHQAALAGQPPPRLISGAEQDLVLAELLAGHQQGLGRPPGWPDDVPPEVRALRGFRDELRDLLMRALERGVTPEELESLGARHARPHWQAAAGVLSEYLDVTALATPGAYDPAGLVDVAASVLLADADLLTVERERWSLVVVDDYQEATAGTARLLDALYGAGRDLLLLGDPDSTTQAFRGADPYLLADAPGRFRAADRSPAATIVLTGRWRQRPLLAAACTRVAERIGAVGGAAQRRAGLDVGAGPDTGVVPDAGAGPDAGVGPDTGGGDSERPGGEVSVHVLRSASQEAAFVAQVLRRWHLDSGLPWSRMAVVQRSARRGAALRRALSAAGVPVTVPAAEVPVRDERAVRPLRRCLRAVLQPQTLDVDTAVELLVSPVGGTDSVGLRRLRQALRRHELSAGGTRPSDLLLVEALAEPAVLDALDAAVTAPARRVGAVLQQGRGAATEPGSDAETVLWAVWDATGLAGPWRRAALAGGPAGQRADRDLDAVVALFDAAARFVDRLPQADAAQFLEYLEAQEVPADTLAERAPDADAVSLVTAQGSAGREWDAVVVTGVQEGVWPDLRVRGSLLGSQELADVLAGRTGAGPNHSPGKGAPNSGPRRAVLDDELRSFHVAVSRARERLVVTAVHNEDERPSPFLHILDPPSGVSAGDDGERPVTDLPRALDLRALVAELRQVLCGPAGAAGAPIPRQQEAARQLARLAAAGVAGADPQEWFGLAPVSTQGPLRTAAEVVEVSPSRVDTFQTCALRWLLESVGGRGGDHVSQSVGTLVHKVAAQLPDGDADALRARLHELWPRLGLRAGWVNDKQRGRAERMLELFAAYAGRAGARPVLAVEQDFDVRVGRARLRGRVDRLEQDEHGRPVVVDLKTGASAPKDADLQRHPQLGTYQLAVDAGGLDPAYPSSPASSGAPGEGSAEPGPSRAGGAALVQLGGNRRKPKEQAQQPLGEDDEPGWSRELVLSVAEGMGGSTFEARVNEYCRVCPARRACPLHAEGRQVTG